MRGLWLVLAMLFFVPLSCSSKPWGAEANFTWDGNSNWHYRKGPIECEHWAIKHGCGGEIWECLDDSDPE